MANHYEAAREALDEMSVKRADLIDEHDNANRPHVIARLHQDIRDAGTRARVHAKLAIVQALYDMRVAR